MERKREETYHAIANSRVRLIPLVKLVKKSLGHSVEGIAIDFSRVAVAVPFLNARFFLEAADLVVREPIFDCFGGSDAAVANSYADVDAGADADDAGAGDEG